MLNKIRNKNILNIILDNLKKKKKMKLFLYNKKMQDKLDITFKDFLEFKFIKILKEKYHLSLNDDVDTKILNISEHPKSCEIFKYSNFVKFRDLRELDLSNNLLPNLSSLKIINTENLEVLLLDNNILKNNIDLFEQLNLKNLIKLSLINNYITNIKVLEKVNFNKLEILNLDYNEQLFDIEVLKKVNFPQLKVLSLNKCRIYNRCLNVLVDVNFKKLFKM